MEKQTKQDVDVLNKMFPITIELCRQDLVGEGYDVSGVTDETMELMAEDMIDGLMEGYWAVLNSLCDKYDIKLINK